MAAICCLAALNATPAQAQWPGAFHVGVWLVLCDLEESDMNKGNWPYWAQAVEGYSTQRHVLDKAVLPKARFDQLQDLGVTLAGFIVDPEHIGVEEGVVEQINNELVARAATNRIMDMFVTDLALSNLASSERLMLHPEEPGDFEDGDGFQLIYDPSFRDYPIDDIGFDRQLGKLKGAGPNCVVMYQPGSISGLGDARKRELSFRRGYLPSPSARDTVQGKYRFSIIMRAPDPIEPNDATPVLRVRIHTSEASITYNIPGSVFDEHGGDVFEHHLGFVELRIDSLDEQQPRVARVIDWRTGA